MSNKNWGNRTTVIVFGIFCLCLIFLFGWRFIELRTEQRVSEYYARQNENSIRPEDVHLACDGLLPNEITECVIKKYEEHEAWDKERRDLHAQEDMAFWALWMFVSTVLAFCAVLGTLYYTRRAAEHTEQMLDEARNTTTEAKKSNEIMREEQRAWLGIELSENEISIRKKAESFRPGSPPVKIKVRNSGATPAKNITVYVKVIVANMLVVDENDLLAWRSADEIVRGMNNGTALPGQKKDIRQVLAGWDFSKAQELPDGCMFGSPYLVCTVLYETMDGKERVTKELFVLSDDGAIPISIFGKGFLDDQAYESQITSLFTSVST